MSSFGVKLCIKYFYTFPGGWKILQMGCNFLRCVQTFLRGCGAPCENIKSWLKKKLTGGSDNY